MPAGICGCTAGNSQREIFDLTSCGCTAWAQPLNCSGGWKRVYCSYKPLNAEVRNLQPLPILLTDAQARPGHCSPDSTKLSKN